MNIREEMEKRNGNQEAFVFQDLEVKPEQIRAVLINEVVPSNPADDFYGGDGAAYLSTAIPLFQKAGAQVNNAGELLEQGIYLTNAVKMPKTAPAIERSTIEKSLPYLEWELSLFPHVKVIMLMGDVAKKAFNMISKKATGKNVIPSVSTYKIRKSEIRSQSSSSRSAVQQAIIDCSDYIKMVQKARKIKVFRAFAISKRADMV